MARESLTNSILRHLDRADLDELLSKCRIINFSKGRQVVRCQDADANLYIIENGKVRVTLFSPEGKEVSFVDLGAGRNFGEISAIDSKPRSANVIALTDCEILIVPPDVFMALVTRNPQVCLEVLQQLAAIVRRLCDRIFEYSTLDVAKRVRLELLRLARENTDYDGVARIPKPNQGDLASLLTCSREAISREYSSLEQVGVLRRERNRLVVEDISGLESLLEEYLPG